MTLYRALRKTGGDDGRVLVEFERRGDRVTLTLTDPEHLNPLSPGLNLQLQRPA